MHYSRHMQHLVLAWKPHLPKTNNMYNHYVLFEIHWYQLTQLPTHAKKKKKIMVIYRLQISATLSAICNSRKIIRYNVESYLVTWQTWATGRKFWSSIISASCQGVIVHMANSCAFSTKKHLYTVGSVCQNKQTLNIIWKIDQLCNWKEFKWSKISSILTACLGRDQVNEFCYL